MYIFALNLRFYVSGYRISRKYSWTLAHIETRMYLYQDKSMHVLSCMNFKSGNNSCAQGHQNIWDYTRCWGIMVAGVTVCKDSKKIQLSICHVILWKDKLDKSHHKWEDVIDMENIKSKIMETQVSIWSTTLMNTRIQASCEAILGYRGCHKSGKQVLVVHIRNFAPKNKIVI